MGSAEGGVEIETVAETNPEAIIRRHADPQPRPARLPGARAGLRDGAARPPQGGGRDRQGARDRRCSAYDADLVEINPLAIVREGGPGGTAVERLVCLDAKITLDDSALARHPGLEDAARPRRGGARGQGGPRGRADLHQARRHDRLHGQRRRPGDDDDGPRQARRRRAGQLPRHRRRRPRPTRSPHAMRLILSDPKVDAILVNIFGGITRGDEVARGLIEARAQQSRDVPMVVRIVGTNAEEAGGPAGRGATSRPPPRSTRRPPRPSPPRRREPRHEHPRRPRDAARRPGHHRSRGRVPRPRHRRRTARTSSPA